MIRCTLLCSCVMALVAALSSNASAQFGNQGVGGANVGGFGTQGIGGIGTQGVGGFGTTGLGTTGQTGFGTTGLGTTGRTGTTGTSTGTNSAFGSTTNRNATTTSRNSTTTNTSPFGNTNTQFGQVSNNATNGQQMGGMDNGSANFFQSQAGGRNGGIGGQNQLGNLFQNQFRAQTAFGANPLFNTQQRKTGGGGQPSLRLGFDIPQRPATEVGQGIESRLQAAATRPEVALESKLDIQGVRVDVADAGVVRLTGAVANDAARRRAANVIRLEPGVKKVINEITVAEATK